jgi:Flp pilus assembly pilin Flp
LTPETYGSWERIAMLRLARQIWNEEDGVLSFEWTLIVTLLVIGIVSGLAGARDAIIDELGDVAQAMLALDDSYVLDRPLSLIVDLDGPGPSVPIEVGAAAGSAFTDAQSFTDCLRSPVTAQNQPGQLDSDS